MRILRIHCHRRAAFLIAAKSMKRKFIGWFARKVGAVPVGRALDLVTSAKGQIYLPEPESEPLLIRGVGTNFLAPNFEEGGLLVLPKIEKVSASAEIAHIISATELRLKKPFESDATVKQLTVPGTKFSSAPKVDQTQVYDAVFDRLDAGGAVGIFPEGGSHDRTELLPLKPGVAIMALGALANNPECGVKIVPCGMNYFHAHKFRSRAVVEFGNPVEVPMELVELYKNGQRREAVSQLLDTVYQALVAVTVTSPDYDTLMLIQAARRLYNPTGKKLPLPMVVELNRRLVKGYTLHKDDPRIKALKKSVLDYNNHLRYLNLRDHQVEYAKFSVPMAIFTFFYRLGKLLVLSIGVLPGLLLFSPVFVAAKIISIRKSREALAASTVKLQGRDVLATWKLLVALAFAPVLYNFYTISLAYWTHRNQMGGRVPEWVPVWAVMVFGYIFFPAMTFAALRFGEVGMDIVKSLRPLVVALNPATGNQILKMRERRQQLSAEVTAVINTFGPEMFPDFDSARIVADPFRRDDTTPPASPRAHQRTWSMDTPPMLHRSATASASMMSGDLPRNESFGNLANIALFATQPPSQNHSRSQSRSGSGVGLMDQGLRLSSIETKAGLDEVSEKIRGAMRERGQLRRRQSQVQQHGQGFGLGEDSEDSGDERKNV